MFPGEDPDLWRLSRPPRLWAAKAISLGFLTVTVAPADLQGLLPSGEVRFAAEYKATSEPICHKHFDPDGRFSNFQEVIDGGSSSFYCSYTHKFETPSGSR